MVKVKSEVCQNETTASEMKPPSQLNVCIKWNAFVNFLNLQRRCTLPQLQNYLYDPENKHLRLMTGRLKCREGRGFLGWKEEVVIGSPTQNMESPRCGLKAGETATLLKLSKSEQEEPNSYQQWWSWGFPCPGANPQTAAPIPEVILVTSSHYRN